MAYFNHAFSKLFLGTGPTIATPVVSTGGFVTTVGTTTATLSTLPPGYFMFVDPKTWANVAAPANCCPLVLASSSILTNDKIGPFAGGYKETNKSKTINPKYVHKYYRVDQCTPQQSVVSVGNTPYTAGLQPADPKCCFEFLCGETYYLRIDVKGSPALRFLNHNAYQNIYAYTGCCTGATPTPVDSTLVMIDWAKMIVENSYINAFIFPIVYDEAGVAWFPPGSTVDPLGGAILPANWWTAYVSPGHTPDACAGLRLFGAYTETKFGDCTFQVTDFFEKEPVRIYASLVDLNGDPCVFEGICVYQECLGVQGMGFGEQVLRDLILSESYLQNYVRSNDMRIREITQGYDIINSVNRNALYTRYYILHTVPRYNNPTGVFDNDQYMLEIITNGTNAALESYMTTWLGTCPDCVTFENEACTPCIVTPIAG
jgi:hypothetical protein